MPGPQYLLASASPRRRQLLEALGIPFEVVANPWEEVPRPGESAAAQVKRLAREKLQHFLEVHLDNRLPVLTADTLLSFQGKALNKPVDQAQAWSFYQRLAGRSHRVLTSVALWDPQARRIYQRTVSTTVHFVPWDEPLYRLYLDRGEWKDAAGGYKIQETGSMLIKWLRGSWTNVVGLPSAEVYGILLPTLRVHED